MKDIVVVEETMTFLIGLLTRGEELKAWLPHTDAVLFLCLLVFEINNDPIQQPR